MAVKSMEEKASGKTMGNEMRKSEAESKKSALVRNKDTRKSKILSVIRIKEIRLMARSSLVYSRKMEFCLNPTNRYER